MGETVVNETEVQHFELGSTGYEYWFNRHKGNIDLDDTSPIYSQAVRAAMVGNCDDISDWRDEMPTGLKAWFDALPILERAAIYAGFMASIGR